MTYASWVTPLPFPHPAARDREQTRRDRTYHQSANSLPGGQTICEQSAARGVRRNAQAANAPVDEI